MAGLRETVVAVSFAALAALCGVPVAAQPLQTITVYNGINHDITSLKLRQGILRGVQKLPPGYGVIVAAEMNDGSCGGWLVARTSLGDAAQALVDVCNNGRFVVTLNAGRGGVGSGLDLTIMPVK